MGTRLAMDALRNVAFKERKIEDSRHPDLARGINVINLAGTTGSSVFRV